MSKREIKVIDLKGQEAVEYARENGMLPYFKPTMRRHEGGWRVFEIGYCKTEDKYVSEKVVLGKYSDHIWILQENGIRVSLNMDLTLDGYIRVFREFEWESFVASSAMLKGKEKP